MEGSPMAWTFRFAARLFVVSLRVSVVYRAA
jgi:hypothetical protein